MPAYFLSVLDGPMTLSTYALCLAAALACGCIVAFAAAFRARLSKSMIISLVVLPMIVETVILMVNGNVGTGVAVAGAFSLVRFRSAPGRAKDIAAIFLSMTAGLACAAGYLVIALLFSVLVGAVLLVMNLLPLGAERSMELHITVPETLSFSTAFDDLFAEYTASHRLISSKTSNMGSLYKLKYSICLKDAGRMQEFMDALRCRNGNLELSIVEKTDGAEDGGSVL